MSRESEKRPNIRYKHQHSLDLLKRNYSIWVPKTIAGHFSDVSSRYADNDFLIFNNGVRYTYANVDRESSVIAQDLKSDGIHAGSHVAVVLENSPQAMLLFFALAKLGAINVAISSGLGSSEMQYLLRISEATHVIAASGSPCFQVLPSDIVGKLNVRNIEKGQCDIAVAALRCARPPGDEQSVAGRLSDIGEFVPGNEEVIIFTSGSTGYPKAVPLVGDALLRTAYGNCLNRRFEEGRRIFSMLPITHVFGLVDGLLAATFVGGAVLVALPHTKPDEILKFIIRECANDLMCVPDTAARLISALQSQPLDFPHLHAVYCSASSCSPAIWPMLREYLGVEELFTGYGMTELCGNATQTRMYSDDYTLATRLGCLLPGDSAGVEEYGGALLECKTRNLDTGAMQDSSVLGELCFRGPKVMSGYYGNAVANKECFTEGGWFKTGDIGRLDESGNLEFIGRVDNVYKINGENVSPEFLESVMLTCPDVRQVTVMGTSDLRYGTVGVAFVQLESDSPAVRETFIQFCKDNLANYQQPKYFEFIDADDWPRTAAGKIRRSVLLNAWQKRSR